jgi:hypothetical protein
LSYAAFAEEVILMLENGLGERGRD